MKTKSIAVGGPLQQFRDFVYNNSRQVRKEKKTCKNAEPSAKKMVFVEVNAEDSTTTYFVAEDRGDNLYRVSQKEIKIKKTAKQVIEETFQPSHSIDGHAGTIVNSAGYRIDLQGYVNNCGTKLANVQLQYGVKRPGSANTFAQVLIPTEGPINCSHDIRLKGSFSQFRASSRCLSPNCSYHSRRTEKSPDSCRFCQSANLYSTQHNESGL